MRVHGISQRKRIAAGIMAIMMLAAILLCVTFLAAEEGHRQHCTEEDCPICACIQMCRHTVRQSVDGVISDIAVIAPILFLIFAASFCAGIPAQVTPVSEKVRLNN